MEEPHVAAVIIVVIVVTTSTWLNRGEREKKRSPDNLDSVHWKPNVPMHFNRVVRESRNNGNRGDSSGWTKSQACFRASSHHHTYGYVAMFTLFSAKWPWCCCCYIKAIVIQRLDRRISFRVFGGIAGEFYSLQPRSKFKQFQIKWIRFFYFCIFYCSICTFLWILSRNLSFCLCNYNQNGGTVMDIN